MTRQGIGFIGSMVVDVVTGVLEPGNLVYSDGARYLTGDDYEAEDIHYGIGGLAANNSVNLGRIGADYPIVTIGKIGADENGRRIRETLAADGISDTHIIETAEHPTSTTQVIYLRDSSGGINRTFRHSFGAMGDFKPQEVDIDLLAGMNMVMVGYFLLMPHFDRPDDMYGTAAGRLLAQLREAGVKTCVDFITPRRDAWWKFERFRKLLQWVDILSIGEDQAEGITGIADEQAAARALVDTYGAGCAIVHCGDKGMNYLYRHGREMIRQANFKVPPGEYAGNAGAGDAFTSGLLHAMHREWDDRECLRFAVAAAAISLGSRTCTDAMRDEAYILDYMQSRPLVSG